MLQLLVTLQTLPTLLTDRLRKDDKGATMVEYGLMLALIAVIAIAAITLLGNNVENKFNIVANKVAN